MPVCPLCLSEIKDDFGLMECESCGAQLMVHVDGRVEFQGAKDVPAEEPAEQPVSGLPSNEPQQEFAAADVMQEFDPELLEVPQPTGSDEPTQMRTVMHEAQDLVPPVSHSNFNLPEAEDKPDVDEMIEEAPIDAEHPFDQPPATPEPEEPAPEVYTTVKPANSPDLSDIAKFGNSDASGARDGSLRYNLFVEGIDTSDVRHAFREALTDRKFMWDTDQILRSVRNGKVQIQNVSASKAFMLISRLRSLPVRIRWEQYAVHQG